MSIKTFVVVGIVGMALCATVGCGGSDDDKPAAAEGTPNKATASSATTTTITAAQTALKPASGGNNNGYGSASTLSSAAQACQSLVTPSAGSASQGLTIADLLKPLENPSGTTGTCDCTADSCTFVACKSATLTIDGTYSFGGGKLKATGLKYVIDAAGAGGAASGVGTKVEITLDADMTATATSLDGTFKSTGTSTSTAGGQTYGSEWDSSLTFKGVTFPSGGGSPTAGSVAVDSTFAVNAGGQSQRYAGTYDVTFPAK